MTTRTPWLLAGAALALYASAGAAVAAEPAARSDKQIERHEMRVYRHDGGPGRMHMSPEHQAERIKTILQLRPDQEPALKAFLEATHPNRDEVRDHFVKFDEKAPLKTTPERLAEMEARMARHQAAMTKRIAATKTFYAALDDKQKKVFDAMPMMMGPGFGPMGHPVHHMRGHGGDRMRQAAPHT